MNLAVRTLGSGPDLVMLHGWGMHAGVLEPLAAMLSGKYRVTCIDLPGHGGSVRQPWPDDPKSLASLLLAAAPMRATWLGWSLGGLAAIQVARDAPSRVARLILLAATPCFTRRPDWPCAMSRSELERFATQFAAAPDRMLQRFGALQFRGVPDAAQGARRLRALLGDCEPSTAALVTGLRVLLDMDLREALASCGRPAGVILGGSDPLIPVDVADALIEFVPRVQVACIEDAGHAPFITHKNEVAAAVAAMMAGPLV